LIGPRVRKALMTSFWRDHKQFQLND
jgi:hypothetical protein